MCKYDPGCSSFFHKVGRTMSARSFSASLAAIETLINTPPDALSDDITSAGKESFQRMKLILGYVEAKFELTDAIKDTVSVLY